MAVDNLELPKNPKQLAKIIDQHVEREEANLSYRRLIWNLAYAYLAQGARRFDVLDPTGRNVEGYALEEDGDLIFRSQELMAALDRIVGRLCAMDVRPRVSLDGLSLEGQRERARAQIIMNSAVSYDQLREVQIKFNWLFTCLGMAGIQGHIIDHPTIGLTNDLEVVHPQELMPFPSIKTDYTKVRGVLRQRTVPLDWLSQKYPKVKSKWDSEMEGWRIQYGEEMGDNPHGTPGTANGISYAEREDSSYGSGDMVVVRIRELWLDGPRGTCSRYILTSGDYTIDDQRFDGLSVYPTLGYGRFIETGSFYGAGAFDLLFSISRELERLMQSLFNNMRDIDRYPFLVLPSGTYHERSAFRETASKLKILAIDPDPHIENFKPFPVEPFNMGDVPGRVAQFAKTLMDQLSPIRNLIDEKGRVDSERGLAYLDEQISQAMTVATRAVENAFGTCYRGVCYTMNRELTISPRALPVGKLDLDLAGAVIDPETNKVSFGEIPVKDISRLTFGIRESSPSSELGRIQKAEYYAMNGLTDPMRFQLFAVEEGLDLPMWMEDIRSAYDSVQRNILLLFGDGETPGQIIVTQHTSMPETQLTVLGAFMGRPLMGMASAEVQNAFQEYMDTLKGWMGMMLPPGVPAPEEDAMMRESTASAGEGGPQGVTQ